MSSGQNRPKVHYSHRLTYTTQERLVGVFVLGALLLLATVLFVNGRTAHLFDDTFEVVAFFQNAQGITPETQVKITGIDVGDVKSIDITPDNRIRVDMRIYERFHGLIRENSKASLGKLSLIGNATIEISLGDAALHMVSENTVLEVEEAVSIDDIIANVEKTLTPVLVKLEQTISDVAAIVHAIHPEDIEQTLHNVAGTTDNVHTLTEQMAQGKGGAGALLNDPQVEAQIKDSIASVEATLKKVDEQVAALRPKLDGIMGDAQATTDQFPELVAHVDKLVAELNTTMATVNPQLQQMPVLITKMNMIMESTDRILQGLQRAWPVSSVIEVPKENRLLEVQPLNE